MAGMRGPVWPPVSPRTEFGTAGAFQVHEAAGAVAGISMALNAVVTSLIVPIVVAVLL